MPGRVRTPGREGSWEWLAFASQLPANPQQVLNQAGNTLIIPGRCILVGASLKNTATTAGEFDLIDGADNTGLAIIQVPVAASGVGNAAVPLSGILCEIGLYLRVTTAIFTGSVWAISLATLSDTAPGE